MNEEREIRHEIVVLAWLLDNHKILDEAGIDAEQWVEDVGNQVSSYQVPADCLYETSDSKFSGIYGDVKKSVILLRECILTHRWHAALKIGIRILERKKAVTDFLISIIRRTMPEAVLQVAGERGETYHEFLRLTKATLSSRNISEYELNLNAMVKHLDDGNMTSARETVEADVKDKNMHGQEYRAHYKRLFHLYDGLLWFAEWDIARQKKDQIELTDDVDFADTSPVDEAMKVHAAKAIQCFSALQNSLHGVWDIFISRYAKLLDYYEMEDKALELLEQYQEKNPDNPNAHIFVYEYHKQHNGSKDILVEILEKLIKSNPSLPVALDLCNLYMLKGQKHKCIPVIFDMLDHIYWQNEDKPWQLLASILTELSDESEDEVLLHLKACWKARADWWPAFHFSFTPDACDMNLVVNKAKVCCLLLGKDFKFVQNVVTMEMEENLKDELLNVCDIRLFDSPMETEVEPICTAPRPVQIFSL